MIVKIIKGVWFFSLLVTVTGLLYNYASFPDEIQLREGSGQAISRNGLFYAVLGLMAIFNAMVFAVTRFMAGDDEFFKGWFLGLVILFNLFLLVSLQFFNLYNSGEKFNYDAIGFVVYGSVSLIIVWASLWPISMIIKRFRPKQTVTEA